MINTRFTREGFEVATDEPVALASKPTPQVIYDNSEKVTDYAFMRHRSPHEWAHTVDRRDDALMWAHRHGYTLHSWHDVNQGNRQGWGAGQRCRFDMLVNGEGVVVHLFHTEYFTRVPCYQGGWCSGRSYATHYVTTVDGFGNTTDPVPVCDEDRYALERSFGDSPVTLHLSPPLLIGSHD